MSAPWSDIVPGAKEAHLQPVVQQAHGGSIALPYWVVRGQKPGKTLLVTSCVHGDEFEGPKCLWRLVEHLHPAHLHGTLVAVTLANPLAYDSGLRVSAHDRQDLARTFPGDRRGTVTEQVAHVLTEEFFRHADFYVDLHSAGQYYAMPPLVGYMLRPEPLLAAQRAAAKAMGIPLVWGTPLYPGRSLSAAGDLGVPCLYLETTGSGGCRAEDVEQYFLGLRRLMAHLGMTEEKLPTESPRWIVEDASERAGFLQVQNRAPCGGYFDSETKPLEYVQKGQRVGTLRDPWGRPLHEIHATHTGLVVFLRVFPRVQPGDALCTIVELPAHP